MRLVLVDSYDSFTHNLVQAFEVLGAQVTVVRADRTSPAEVARKGEVVVLGPGPGRPEDSGCLIELVTSLGGRRPLLGVCLGHQAVGLAFGGRVVRHRPVHGHATPVHHDGAGLFAGLPSPVAMTRYHSLVVDPGSLPEALVATAVGPDGAIMALRHRTLPIHGVQFHPESVLSGDDGLAVLGNFLELARARRAGLLRASA